MEDPTKEGRESGKEQGTENGPGVITDHEPGNNVAHAKKDRRV